MTDNFEPVPTVEDAFEQTAPPEPALWQRLRAWWGKRKEARRQHMQQRLQNLSWSIEHQPDSATHLVLRGELYLDCEEYALAAQDFEHALSIASAALQTSAWGVLEQALQDRAQTGLEQAQRHVNQ